MGKQRTPTHGVTPPKGRPTRPRNARRGRRRLFGSTAQWLGVVFLLLIALAVLVILTDGDDTPSSGGADPIAAPAEAVNPP